MISNKLFTALKTSPIPNYKIAQAAGVHPNWISKAIHSAIKIRPDDPRLIRIGKILGLKMEDLFEENRETQK